MKLKEGFLVREIMNEFLVVPVGERMVDFNGLISLNASGVLMWNALKTGTTAEELVSILLERYEVDEETAAEDVDSFLKTLQENDLLKEV